MAQLNIANQSACPCKRGDFSLVVVDWRFLGSRFSLGSISASRLPLHGSDTNAADEPAKMSFYRHLSAMPDHDAM